MPNATDFVQRGHIYMVGYCNAPDRYPKISYKAVRYYEKPPIAFNPRSVELLVSIFRNLKLELLTQFPASNDEFFLFFWKIDISPSP